MSSETDQKLLRSINRLLASKECATEFQLDSTNQKIDFSLPENLLKAIEICRNAKEFELSLECSERLSKLNPDSPLGFQRLIQDYLILDRIAEAFNIAIVAVEKFHDDPGMLLLTNNIYRSKNQPEHALVYSSHLLDKHPALPAGYYCSAQNLVDLGKVGKAKKIIKTLLNSIDSPLSRILARDFYRNIGLRKKAKALSRKIAKDSPSFETNMELAMDLLVLGKTKRFFDFAKRKNLINNEVHAQYFDDLISKEFAMNLSKPLNQSWRSLCVQYKVFNHFDDPTFNKYPSEINHDNNQLPWICIIHVGKCAGETVVRTLKQAFPQLRQRIIEYHLFDSNLLIKQLLELSKKNKNIEIVFCTRNPLERWVSSFNWDFYTYKLNRLYYCPAYILDLFDNYNSVKKLARGIYNGEKEAFILSKSKHFIFGHMAMGQSWYLPKSLIESFQEIQMHVIRTENIRQDLLSSVKQLTYKYGNLIEPVHDINIPVLKDSKHFRANHSFGLVGDLSSEESEAVIQHLSEDMEVNKIMTDRFVLNS